MKNRCTLGVTGGLLLAMACGDGSIEDSDTPAPSGGAVTPREFRKLTAVDVAAESRVVRLSHVQYASTVRDLLGIDEALEANFVPDALNGFNFDTSNDLRVDPRLGPQYRVAAEELAAQVVSDAAVFARVVTCNEADASCPDAFIASFGERAFRRPLTQTETTRFRALFDQAGELGDSGNAFRDGVQLVVEAMLQAPHFLYRTELSEGALQAGRVPLDDWEIASRLSYFLYDSMPDAQLFARARQGQLRTAEQLRAEVSRMLGDERASDKFVSFHEQVWQFGRFAKIAPDPTLYADLPAEIIDRVRDASREFISSVIVDGGGLNEFLTAPYAYADAELGSLYGRTLSGSGLTRVDFAPGERKGFLMQVGFLASHAYSRKTDPIHRGLFIQRDILCRTVPDPPPGAQNTPPPQATEPIVTTRDEISLLTGQLYCPSCHSQINGPGFSFEGFDAVGRARTQENGENVDTSGSIELDGEMIDFAGASEMIDALAQSEEARDCYTARWLEFAFGRRLADSDLALRDQIAGEPRSVQDIITSLATSADFISRGAGAAQ
jgi:hypothetical protein